jgi:hypothetical protein
MTKTERGKDVAQMESSNFYERATIQLWTRSEAAVMRYWGRAPLAEAAVHALLCRLRACASVPDLSHRYDLEVPADLALVASLAPDGVDDQLLGQLRDAGFYLRWRELVATGC